MLAKEEQLRALNETKELLMLKKSEEKKKECLEQALKSKQDAQKKKRDNQILLKSVDAVKEETQKEVEEQRDLLKKRIAAIRNKSNRRNRQIKREINIIRSQMAQGLMEADKIGDKEKCVKSLGNEEMIKSYCDDHMNLTPQENSDCKDKERFCYVCCETEFGAIHVSEREICYNSCDELVKVNGKGEWVWEGKRSQGQTNDSNKK
jgi:hypothetical protein